MDFVLEVANDSLWMSHLECLFADFDTSMWVTGPERGRRKSDIHLQLTAAPPSLPGRCDASLKYCREEEWQILVLIQVLYGG